MEITERINNLIRDKNLSPSEFASKIGVNKATLSHVLSGRNKPSLDFIIKICEAFHDVDPNSLIGINSQDQDQLNDSDQSLINNDSFKEIANTEKNIERIVIFYTDNSFKEYKSNAS